MQRKFIMNPVAPYIEIYPFKNMFNSAYPRDMWQILEHDPSGIVNARTAFSRKEAELIKHKFQSKNSK